MTWSIELEWLDAPSVSDAAERATWASISFRAGMKVLTLLHDPTTRSVRNGYVGSALPLAEWVAERALRLVHERREPVRETEAWLEWRDAHCFRVARAGGAMPDLYARRIGAEVIELDLRPDVPPPGIGVRFLESGLTRVSANEFERGLHQFLQSVVERFATLQLKCPEPLEKRLAGVSSDPRRIDAARLGLLPTVALSPTEFAIAEASSAPDDTRLAEAKEIARTLPAPLAHTRAWRSLQGGLAELALPAQVPWLTGWEAARRVRSALGLSQAAHNDEVFSETQFSLTDHVKPATWLGTGIDSVHLWSPDGPPCVVTTNTSAPARRFRAARSLFHGLFSGQTTCIAESPYLRSAEANAFAAELTAPLEALEALKPSSGTWDEELIRRCAATLAAPPAVVRHQVENHPELGEVAVDG